MPRKIQPLDRFSEVERRVLERVRDVGELTVPFSTKNAAYNYKFRILRYIQAMCEYAPDDDLTKIAKLAVVKLRDNILTITRKDTGMEAQDVLAVLNGASTGTLNADFELQLQAEEEAGYLDLERAGMARRNVVTGKWEEVPPEEWPCNRIE